MGPNVKRLVASKVAVDAMAAGVRNPVGAAARLLTTPGRLADATKRVRSWVAMAINAVRLAPDYDPAVHGGSDEEIAGRILDEIERKTRRGADR